MLCTRNMGDVAVDSSELRAMQASDYILHARGGRLERAGVQKTRLPRDPHGHTQRLNIVQAPDGMIYGAQHTLLHRSTDGGETWEDEVYYLSHGDSAGYAATICLDGEEMLTLTGSCYGDVGSWDNCVGNADFAIIRWRLV